MYPALAVAELIRQQHPEANLTFVGSVGGFEKPLIEASTVQFNEYREVRAGPVVGVNPLRLINSLFQLFLGLVQSLGILRQLKPNVIFLTGGWVGLPIALASEVFRIPSLIYLPDIEPGATIRALQRFADQVAVTTSDSSAYITPSKMVVTGYPLRQDMLEAAQPEGRQKAIAHFQLDPNRKTVLVFGGSRGARSINQAVMKIAPQLLSQGLQIIHVTGTLDWEQNKQEWDALGAPNAYHLYPYLHDDMGLAMAAADLVICRSGASTLAELPLFSLPSILVPYPHAWRYQKVNAEWLAQRGAAVVMEDEKMATELLPTIQELMQDDAKWRTMRDAARALAKPEGTENVTGALLRLAGGSR